MKYQAPLSLLVADAKPAGRQAMLEGKGTSYALVAADRALEAFIKQHHQEWQEAKLLQAEQAATLEGEADETDRG